MALRTGHYIWRLSLRFVVIVARRVPTRNSLSMSSLLSARTRHHDDMSSVLMNSLLNNLLLDGLLVGYDDWLVGNEDWLVGSRLVGNDDWLISTLLVDRQRRGVDDHIVHRLRPRLRDLRPGKTSA